MIQLNQIKIIKTEKYFWSRSFLVLSISGANIEIIKKYIQEQGGKMKIVKKHINSEYILAQNK